MSPALAGGFLTTAPPGKSILHLLKRGVELDLICISALKSSYAIYFPSYIRFCVLWVVPSFVVYRTMTLVFDKLVLLENNSQRYY